MVDDDPKAVEVIATFLPVSEYTVVRAYGGAEAITLAERLRPDVVLLDLMMPEVNGFAVVEALQRNKVTARIPIIIVTAKHITAQDRSALSNGSDMVVEIVRESRPSPGPISSPGCGAPSSTRREGSRWHAS